MARLGDVCKLVSGNSLPEMIVAEKGELPYVKVAELNLPENIPNITTSRQFVSVTNISAKQIIPVGTVIFPKRGGAIGTNKKRLVSTPICMDLNLMGAIPSSKLYPQYLYYFFENIDMGALSNGSSVPQINNSDIAPLEIRIPDITTQKDIATRLDKVTELIALRKEQLVKLDQLVKSRFIELFGRPVSNSKGWNTEKMREVAPAVNYSGDFEDAVWLLNLDMVEAQTGRILDYLYVNEEEVGNSTCTFDTTNVLYSKLRPYLNKVVIPDRCGYATSELIPLKPNSMKLERTYLAFMLRSDEFVNMINEKVAGAKMPRVSMSDFREFDVPVPPMELQKRFAAFVEQTDKSKLEIQQSLDKLELLKKSLMQEYFG